MKKILITGASSGIGRATALKLLSEGNEVMLTARRLDRLTDIVEEFEKSGEKLTAASRGKAYTAQLDVTDAKSVEKFLKQHHSWLENFDVLVNNAGLALGREPLQETPFEDHETMIQTNVIGLLRITRSLIPLMIKQKKGHIVNMGSVAAKASYIGGAVYCATKAAVHMITDSLRMDLGGTGIRVSTIAPGRVAETEFSEVRFKGNREVAAKVYEGYRVMTSSDVADVIAWVINTPEHVNIQELVLLPTDQPNAVTLAPKK